MGMWPWVPQAAEGNVLLPFVSAFSCACRVMEALYVLNTLAVSPSIKSWRCLFKTVVWKKETRQRGKLVKSGKIKCLVFNFPFICKRADFRHKKLQWWGAEKCIDFLSFCTSALKLVSIRDGVYWHSSIELNGSALANDQIQHRLEFILLSHMESQSHQKKQILNTKTTGVCAWGGVKNCHRTQLLS